MVDLGHIGGPIVIPQVAQISFRWTLEDGKTAHNVLYGRYVGTFAGTSAQANGIFSALSSGSVWTGISAGFSTSTFFAGVDIRDINSASNAIIQSTAAAVPGTGATGALPNEVAVALTVRTARVGPRYRGRIYLPWGVGGVVQPGNVIGSASVTNLTAWGQAIAGAFSGQGYTFCLGLPARAAYTGKTGTHHDARPAESPSVTQVVCRDNHWDSQRRRGLR